MIKKKSLHIESYTNSNKTDFLKAMSENPYFTDLKGFSFDMFPNTAVFLLRGDLWLVKRKNLIFSFCVVIDFRDLPISLKKMYSEACKIDYKDILKYNDVFLQELGVAPHLRGKGFGTKMLNNVQNHYKNRSILLKSEETAIDFWKKKNFTMIDGTQKNNMILLSHQ